MHDIHDLEREFSGVDVVAVGVVGDVGDVEGANVRYMRETLQEIMLWVCQSSSSLSLKKEPSYPIAIVDGEPQLAEAAHPTARDEGDDLASQHPSPPSWT